jgi:glycosyltransferase 2 family protein
MQAGTFATVPAVAAVAAIAGRRRLAVTLAAAGAAAWVGAKGIKLLGGRERPSRILDDVVMREGVEGDRGWISGHTAVATTLAGILADELPGPVRPFLWSVPVATAFGRMYVGAHLPHDTLGGAGFGLMLSSLVPRR